MRQLHLNDEDVEFSTLVREVENGESVTILRGERPVAQIIPFPETPLAMTADRLAAIKELNAIMEKGMDLGVEWKGRDELYDRALNCE